MQLLYVAKKYLVKSLERRCIEYLRGELNAENAIMLLNQPTLIDDKDLINECWECIDGQSEEFMKTEEFKDIDHETLHTILSRDSLQAKEVSIFNAVLGWAKQACTRNNLLITGKNQRKIIGDALYKIRFTTMTQKEFADTAAQSGVLSLEESHNLFLHFSGNKQELPFISIPRFNRCKLYNDIVKYNGGLQRGSVDFTVDRDITVIGFTLYGLHNEARNCPVGIVLCDLDKYTSVGEHKTNIVVDGSPIVCSVYFTTPIKIKAGTRYSAYAELYNASQRYWAGRVFLDTKQRKQSLPNVKSGNVTFKFSDHDEYNLISEIMFNI